MVLFFVVFWLLDVLFLVHIFFNDAMFPAHPVTGALEVFLLRATFADCSAEWFGEIKKTHYFGKKVMYTPPKIKWNPKTGGF